MKIKFIFLLGLACLFTFSAPVQGQESLAYQLAMIHTKAQNPDKAWLKKKIDPQQAVVSEFQWLLESMDSRCLNPQAQVASTMVETWTALRQNKKEMPLLDVARELSKTAKNTKLFGTDKINFRMTSQFWLQSKLSGQGIEKIIKAHVLSQK